MLNLVFNKLFSLSNLFFARILIWLEKKRIVKTLPYSIYKQNKNAIVVNHPFPLNFTEKDRLLFANYNSYETGHEEVFLLENVNIDNKGVVFKGLSNYGMALPHPVFRYKFGPVYLLAELLFKKKRIIKSEKYFVLIFDFWSADNYYHWLIDSLPRYLNMQTELTSDDYSLLLPENPAKFVLRTIEKLEIKHITYISKSEYLQLSKLLLSNYTAGSGHIHPQKVLSVRGLLNDSIRGKGNYDRIYVSRSKQKSRIVSNEDEILLLLAKYDFKIIYFEDYSFDEQLKLARGASCFISSHGANMTNLMFMPEGSKVLELIREDKPNFCYWALAGVCNLNYYYQLCEITNKDHLFVNLNELKKNLNLLLND